MTVILDFLAPEEIILVLEMKQYFPEIVGKTVNKLLHGWQIICIINLEIMQK
jgi:hypothetical protein